MSSNSEVESVETRSGKSRWLAAAGTACKQGVTRRSESGSEMLSGRPVNMTQTIPERRAMRRFDMRLPAAVRLAGGDGAELTTETENVSARGLFFRVSPPLHMDDRVAVTLTFPPHVTLTEKVRVRFDARVIRVEAPPFAGAPVGIAAAIEAYEFLRNYALEDVQPTQEPEGAE